MRVFMLGWEFPPHISGGLGTACYGMTKGLDELGVNVCFVLPTAIPLSERRSHVSLRSPADLPDQGVIEEVVQQPFEHVQLHQVDAILQPYASPQGFAELVKRQIALSKQRKSKGKNNDRAAAASAAIQAAVPSGTFVRGGGSQYVGDLMGQVNRYARLAVEIAETEQFDVIHAHDWMTYPGGLAVAAASGKPLVIHVHSTEFDRAGNNVNQQVYDIERAGMHGADRVVCVSYLTRSIATSRYGLDPAKVEVVYNAVELPEEQEIHVRPIHENEKIVLFLGRVTMQKGPEYFLEAAKKVVQKFPSVRFVMAGSGDMINRMIELAAKLGIGKYVTFTGFLRGRDVAKIFQMADLYVMPSVSEPFGIAPLEALSHNVPVLISRQSGVSEVLTNALKVDFWDVDEMANKILAVLRHPPLQRTLREAGSIELQKFSWRDSAAALLKIYERVIGERSHA